MSYDRVGKEGRKTVDTDENKVIEFGSLPKLIKKEKYLLSLSEIPALLDQERESEDSTPPPASPLSLLDLAPTDP